MVERREDALFLLEMPDEFFGPETLLDQFNRNLTAKMCIVRQPDKLRPCRLRRAEK